MLLRGLAALLIGLVWSLWTVAAFAQSLTPPRLLVQQTPVYPEQATGDATVIVEIVVEPDGTVSEARVTEGAAPFAAAALDAAKRCRFEPARRGDRSIRARIRLAMTFTPPPAPSSGADAAQPESPPPATRIETQPAVTAVDEVLVTGRRIEPRSPTEHRLGRAEMRVMPGAFGDPFRAIDLLPGLVPIVSCLPYFYIRGAPPSSPA